MTRYFLALGFCVVAWFATLGTGHASSTILGSPTVRTPTSHTPLNPTTSINSLRLRCYVSENIGKSSRAIVLQFLPSNELSKNFDFAITTAHGLMDDSGKTMENCQVNLPGGETHEIKAIVIAPDYKQGQASDWAIIAFEKLESKAIIRHQVSADMSNMAVVQIANARLSVLFSKARGLPHNGQICNLLPRQYAGLTQKKHAQFLAHNCRAIAGQSGSPITVIRNDQPVVLGIHVGSSMIYAHPTPSSPLRYQGYMRVIDQEFMATFAKILPKIEAKLIRKGDK